MKKILLYLLVVLPAYSINGIANDSLGALGAGGIVFEKTNDISMEKEILTISLSKIRVEYEFLNLTEKPLRKTILFPMPFYQPEDGCGVKHSGSLNNFKVWVNDKEITTSKTVRAELNGKDVTSQLRKLGFADEDIAEYRGVKYSCGDVEIKLSGKFEKNLDALISEGLVKDKKYPWPSWSASYVYSWSQDFPPKGTLYVVHEYEPFEGRLAGSGFSSNDAQHPYWHIGDYCTDDGTIRAAQAVHKRTAALFSAFNVQYILTTGANWSGPIKDFTLNLKKENDNQVVSLCFPGHFKKKDALTLTSNIKDFVPKEEINAIFYVSFPSNNSDLKHDSPITVVVSPDVLKTINKLSFDEKKRVSQAVITGNHFIPQHFDGSAYATDPENQSWFDNTAPLIAGNRDSWSEYGYNGSTAFDPERTIIDEEAGRKFISEATRLVCPNIKLYSIQTEYGKTILSYRTTNVGKIVNENWPHATRFDRQGEGKTYEVSIELNGDNLISKVIPSDFIYTNAYTVQVNYMNDHLRDFKRGGYKNNDMKESQDVDISDFTKFIKQVESQALSICK